jgi:hypothetical protein
MSNHFKYILIALFTISVTACEDELKLPDNTIEFESDQIGFGADETELTININFSRAVSEAGTLSLSFETTGIEYGTDFTTDPASTAGVMSIDVPKDATSVSFKVIKSADILLDGDESIAFSVASSVQSLIVGSKSTLSLTFGEILALAGSININGGGDTYPNKVFIDLSAKRQTAIARTAWDFGFSSGSDFRMILNSSNGMMAKVLNKTDLNSVTASDTVGFGLQLSLDAVFAAITSDTPPSWVPEAITWIDDPTGDLNGTAIASISATAAENKVYIINRGSGPGATPTQLGWKKIRVVRNGTGYTLQHADISATSFSEIQITKDPNFSFQYVSMANGVVEVEPAKEKWDIAWTAFANSTNFGSGPVPYYFQDMILQNTNGVETAQVLTADIAYDNFTEADLAGITFETSQTNIGSSWRSGGGPGSGPSLKNDRFYIIKDADGNVYKLKFTALLQSGERGKPAFDFELIKGAS